MLFRLLILSIWFILAVSGLSYIWPDGYINDEGKTIFFVWRIRHQDLQETDNSTDRCLADYDKQLLREYTYSAYNATIELIRVTLDTSGLNSDIEDGKVVTITVGNKKVSTHKESNSELLTNIFSLSAVWILNCGNSNAIRIIEVPCDAHRFSLHNLCQERWVCMNRLGELKMDILKKPQVFNGEDFYKGKAESKDKQLCFPVLTYIEHIPCKSTVPAMALNDAYSEKYCKISSSSVLGEKVDIFIPNPKGSKVCISYHHNNVYYQNCKTVEDSYARFRIPKDSSKVNVDCSGNSAHYVKETKLDCPLSSTAFSDTVCKNSRKPRLLWTSIIWLFLGLPTLFLLNFLYLCLNRWWIFKQIKINDSCIYCKQQFSNLLEMSLHEKCEYSLCPYCGNHQITQSALASHTLMCNKKSESFHRIKEIIDMKWFVISNRIDSRSIYTSKWSRALWFAIFFMLFVASFARTRHSESFSRRGMVNPEAIPNYPRDAEVEDDNDYEPDPPIHVTKELINGKLSLLAEGLSNINENIRDLTSVIPTRYELMTELKNLQINLTSITKNAMITAILESEERKVCSHLWTEVDINTLLPDWIADRGVEIIRLNKEDTAKLFSLQHKLSQSACGTEGSKTSKGIHSVNAAEAAAVASAGRADIQVTIGGGGSRPELALGGSTQTKVNMPSDNEAAKSNLGKELDEFERSMNIPLRSSRHLPRYMSHNAKRVRSKRSIEEDEVAVQKSKSKLDIDKISESFSNDKWESVNERHVEITAKNGKRMKTRILKMSKKHPIVKVNKNSDFKKYSHQYEKIMKEMGEQCNIHCLHLPDSCECVGSNIPEDGKVKVPWAVINIFDEKPFKSRISFSQEIATNVKEIGGSIIGKSYLSGQLELYEGNSIGWKITMPRSKETHTLTLAIMKLATLYQTKFLYFTCDRTIETEVKSYCTGGCGDYCGGRMCLGSEIWKWQNCRNWACNPLWCWAIGDGCCCCGVNVYCSNANEYLAVWEVEPIRTEFVLCLYYNEKAFHCQKVDESTEYEVDNMFKVGVSRASAEQFTHPKHLATIFKLQNIQKTSLNKIVGEPDKIYIDPDVCFSTSACNHGSVGDLQSDDLACLTKIGHQCAENSQELAKMGCANKIYFSESGSSMSISCNKGDYHSCNHHHAVKYVGFDSVKKSKEIHEEFTEKHVVIDAMKKEFLLSLTSKRSSGLINFQISTENLQFKKESFKADIKTLIIEACTGCYSCTLGFSCKAKVESNAEEPFLATLHSSNERITIAHHSVTITPPMSDIMIWGFTHVNVEETEICLKWGVDTLKCSKTQMSLHEPTGNFIPIYEDSVGISDETEAACIGLSWFKCAGQSIRGFFSGMFDWFKRFYWAALIIVLTLVIVIFLPYIARFTYGFLKLFKKGKKIRMPKRDEILNLAQSVKAKKMDFNKKFDTPEEFDILPFLNDIYPNTV